jgi:hypothetical protein
MVSPRQEVGVPISYCSLQNAGLPNISCSTKTTTRPALALMSAQTAQLVELLEVGIMAGCHSAVSFFQLATPSREELFNSTTDGMPTAEGGARSLLTVGAAVFALWKVSSGVVVGVI